MFLNLVVLGSLPLNEAHAAVGKIQGTADVSANGEVRYVIPLRLPPGTRGLGPDLALQYGHRNSGSIAGVGWSVSGLSVIYRCRSTWAQDQVARDVRNDAGDRFCLDGNRLRLVAGLYGSANSEYRTELESFSRVRAFSTAGQGPKYFEVERKDGLIYEYGKTSNARVESLGQTTVRAWALNRIRDRFGNEVTYAYTEDSRNGSYRINYIKYAGNPKQGVSPPYQVRFIYEGRPSTEIDAGYVAGSLVKEVKRLSQVDLKHSGSVIRSYKLDFEPVLSTTGRSRLASVRECVGSDCLAASTFAYQDGQSGLGAEYATTAAIPSASRAWPIDVNGDGREDLLYASGGKWRLLFASSSGQYSAPVNTGISSAGHEDAVSIDYDADGRADLLVPYAGNTWWVLRGAETGLRAAIDTGAPLTATGRGEDASAIDINGDGYDDLVWVDRAGGVGGDAIRYRLRAHGPGFENTVRTLVGPLPAGQQIGSRVFANWSRRMPARAPDFNGDGRADLVYRWSLNIDEPDGPATSVHRIAVVCQGGATFGSFTINAASEPYFGDFNGDGKSDLLYYDSSATWRYALSTGTGFTQAGSAGSVAGYGPGWVILDWDGDGYDDLLAPHLASQTWHLKRSTGEALSAATTTGLSAASSSAATVTDINGDGLADLAYAIGGVWRYRLHRGQRPDLLRSVSDGYGNENHFVYAPLSAAAYTRHSDATYPAQDYSGAMSVATSASASDGIGGQYTINYAYFGARTDLQGRGFQGFDARSSTDSRNGMISTVYYERAFPLSGKIYRSETRQSSGALVAKSTMDWTTHGYGDAGDARFYPFAAATTQTLYSVGGVGWNGQTTAIMKTAIEVDRETSAVTKVTRTTTEPAEANGLHAGNTWTEQTRYSDLWSARTGSHWCLGFPTRITQTRSHTGTAAVTRTAHASWDAERCEGVQVTLEPGDSDWQVKTDFAYDGFGNRVTESVKGIGLPARITRMSFGSDGRFPASVTNPLGETSTLTWSPAHGRPATITDANGLQTRWQYDAFGRLTLVSRPDGTSTRQIFADCAPSGCRNDNHRLTVTTQQRDSTGKVFHDQWVDFDHFERPISSGTRLMSGSHGVATVSYDSLGRISQKGVACIEGACDPGHRFEFGYDLIGRPLSITRPRDATHPNPVSVTYAYQGLTTVTTDETGVQSSRVRNANGQVARIVDALGYALDYEHDAMGHLAEVTDSAGNTLQSDLYNRRGLRSVAFDVDRGSSNYTYNALGELLSRTDATGQTTSYTYDELGRLLNRVIPEGTGSIVSRWTWGSDPAKHEVGRLTESQISGSGVADYMESYFYDSLGRPSETRYAEGSNTYQVNRTYSSRTGMPESLTYPGSTSGYRLKLRFAYAHGHLVGVEDFNDAATQFWVAEASDAQGVVTRQTLGREITTDIDVDGVTGLVQSIRSEANNGASPQRLTYTWDAAGNLLSRSDSFRGLSETFSYDALHRLVSSSAGSSSNHYVYDRYGNITQKTGVGAYTYDSSRIHQVRRLAQPGAAEQRFEYDANGRMTARSGGEILWFANNLPKRIRQRAGSASNSSEFQYTPAGGRWWHRYRYGGGIYTHLNIGGLMEKVSKGSTVDYRHTIYANGRPVALYSRKTSGANALRYLLYDHLGSTDVVTDSNGSIELRESFDAFGDRRGANWSGSPRSSEMGQMRDLTRRGYTGHEHLDSTGLVHMNGRVYDPLLGRFLSADPFIDGFYDTQGWNRYSYVHNRPLSFTDPSGFAGKAGHERKLPRNPGIGDALGDTRASSTDRGMQVCLMFICGNPFGSPASRNDSSGHSRLSPWAHANLNVYAGRFGGFRNAGSTINGGSDGIGTAIRNAPPSSTPPSAPAFAAGAADFPGILADSAVPGHYYAGLAQDSWRGGHYGWAAAYAVASLADAAMVVGSFGVAGSVSASAKASISATARHMAVEGKALTTVRLTAPGETFLRYESGNPAFSRVTSGGGVTPGTYAAPVSDGFVSVRRRGGVYNLPNPEIPRTSISILEPPPGTPIVGPRPVSGGTGNEVLFPQGF